jgi:hypothetical protein
MWPALIKLSNRIRPERLAAIYEVHLPSGRHEVRTTPFPDWVPREVMNEAGNLEEAEAAAQIGEWLTGSFK